MIKWIKFPRMEILNTPPHKVATCFEAGEVCLDGRFVSFPAGWSTDVTSTPRLLFWLVPQLGGHNSASLLHDRLLDLKWPRHLARRYMKEQLRNLAQNGDVTKFRAMAIFIGVWAFDQYKKVI